jgi:hypothetical protein
VCASQDMSLLIPSVLISTVLWIAKKRFTTDAQWVRNKISMVIAKLKMLALRNVMVGLVKYRLD